METGRAGQQRMRNPFPGRGRSGLRWAGSADGDARYNNPPDGPDKLTGSLYKALAPSKQVYKPTEWNHYVITCQGSKLKVVLNDEVIQDVDLGDYDKPVERHDGSAAPALKDRPRKGHI